MSLSSDMAGQERLRQSALRISVLRLSFLRSRAAQITLLILKCRWRDLVPAERSGRRRPHENSRLPKRRKTRDDRCRRGDHPCLGALCYGQSGMAAKAWRWWVYADEKSRTQGGLAGTRLRSGQSSRRAERRTDVWRSLIRIFRSSSEGEIVRVNWGECTSLARVWLNNSTSLLRWRTWVDLCQLSSERGQFERVYRPSGESLGNAAGQSPWTHIRACHGGPSGPKIRTGLADDAGTPVSLIKTVHGGPPAGRSQLLCHNRRRFRSQLAP
jgi:hypothetical protein